ncbi:MAG: hypothetical protein A2W28_02710 [Gammaproteobacteria bacterium RBG_16_51_14]|nr:MAG: hypothetical protein A2W28_02710 [Gammaproteobacteria bacterium RBG_16_51_14]
MDTLYTIEHGAIGDLDALVNIENEIFDRADSQLSRRAFRYHINSHNLLLVAKSRAGENTVVSGYLLALLHRKSARVYSIAVRTGYQKQGIASALLSSAIRAVSDLGIERIALEVKVVNDNAIKLYQQFGFSRRKAIPDYYPDGMAALYMEMPLVSQKMKTRGKSGEACTTLDWISMYVYQDAHQGAT